MESLEVSMEVQQQKIYALLDFVMKCNRNHRFTSRILEPEDSVVSMMKDAVFDSAIIVDSLTDLSPSEDENEIVDVQKEHVEDNLPKFHPPRKGFSAIRIFPPGCGRGAPPVKIIHGSKCLRNGGSRAKKRDLYGEASTKVAKKSRTASFSSEDHKIFEDPMRKTSRNEDGRTEGKFSREFANVKAELRELATGPESTMKRVVVHALSAARKCPWRQAKRVFKSKPTNRNLEGEGL